MNDKIVEVDVSSLKPHPAISGLVPGMSDPDFEKFREDIRECGVREPVLLADDGVTVLDGRHRLRAAQELGMKTMPARKAQLNGLSEEAFALRAALMRRHLNRGQRAALALRIKERLVTASKKAKASKGGKAKAQRNRGEDAPCLVADAATKQTTVKKPRARTAAAKAAGASTRDVRLLEDLEELAPDLAAKFKNGDIGPREARSALNLRLCEMDIEDAARRRQGSVPPCLRVVLPWEVDGAGTHVGEFLGALFKKGSRNIETVWRITEGPHAQTLLKYPVPDDIDRQALTVPRDSDLGRLAAALTGSDDGRLDFPGLVGTRCILTVELKVWGPVVTGVAREEKISPSTQSEPTDDEAPKDGEQHPVWP